jgi:hypothetical protein
VELSSNVQSSDTLPPVTLSGLHRSKGFNAAFELAGSEGPKASESKLSATFIADVSAAIRSKCGVSALIASCLARA